MLYKAELFFLYLLGFTLPILEAPKTAATVLYALCWLAHRMTRGTLRLRLPDAFEWVLLALITVVIASTIANWPAAGAVLHKDTAGLRDTLVWCGVFWLIYRGGYDTDVKTKLLHFLLAGAAVGIMWGVWQVVAGIRPFLEFNSAGVVTQSAIYLGVMLMVVFGHLFAADAVTNRVARVFAWGCLVLFSAGLMIMGRRGGLLAVGVAIVLIAAVHTLKRHTPATKLLGITSAVVAAMALAFALTPSIFHHRQVIEKTARLFADDNTRQTNPILLEFRYGDQTRLDGWRIGFVQAIRGDRLLLGVGPRKFNQIEVDKLHFDPPLNTNPFKPSHAHNLFLTKWAEEGLLGLLAFLSLLGLVAYRLAAKIDTSRWTWTAAVGAWIVPVAAGLFNTPWRQEHALLAMILFALHFARDPEKNPVHRLQ